MLWNNFLCSQIVILSFIYQRCPVMIKLLMIFLLLLFADASKKQIEYFFFCFCVKCMLTKHIEYENNKKRTVRWSKNTEQNVFIFLLSLWFNGLRHDFHYSQMYKCSLMMRERERNTYTGKRTITKEKQ